MRKLLKVTLGLFIFLSFYLGSCCPEMIPSTPVVKKTFLNFSPYFTYNNNVVRAKGLAQKGEILDSTLKKIKAGHSFKETYVDSLLVVSDEINLQMNVINSNFSKIGVIEKIQRMYPDPIIGVAPRPGPIPGPGPCNCLEFPLKAFEGSSTITEIGAKYVLKNEKGDIIIAETNSAIPVSNAAGVSLSKFVIDKDHINFKGNAILYKILNGNDIIGAPVYIVQ